MISLVQPLILGILGSALFISAARSPCEPASESPKPAVQASDSLAEVAANPEQHVNRTVRLRGRLENQGKNYFTSLRVALIDEDGNSLYVRPWLPLELPRRPRGAKGRKPDVLSNYLGKQVELTGTVSDRRNKGSWGCVSAPG